LKKQTSQEVLVDLYFLDIQNSRALYSERQKENSYQTYHTQAVMVQPDL